MAVTSGDSTKNLRNIIVFCSGLLRVAVKVLDEASCDNWKGAFAAILE